MPVVSSDTIAVHTSLCYVEGYSPIYVAPMKVADNKTVTSIQQNMPAVQVHCTMYNNLAINHVPAILASSRIKVSHKLAQSSIFYDSTSLSVTYQNKLAKFVLGNSHKSITRIYSKQVKSYSSVVGKSLGIKCGVETVKTNKALNALLLNLFSNGSFGMQVLSTLKPVVPNSINYVIKAAPLIGRYAEVLLLPSELSDIASVSEMYGLNIGYDNRSICGVIGFTEPRKLNIKLVDGTKIVLHIEPKYIERIF